MIIEGEARRWVKRLTSRDGRFVLWIDGFRTIVY